MSLIQPIGVSLTLKLFAFLNDLLKPIKNTLKIYDC